MSLGPRLDLRQSQSLVMTPQLQQAIKLLALSNLEIETFIAEELEKNPLLEAERGSSGDDEVPLAPEPDFETGVADPDALPEADAAGGDGALDIVDRACIIYGGQVLFAGSPEDLVADENVRRLYLGESFEL